MSSLVAEKVVIDPRLGLTQEPISMLSPDQLGQPEQNGGVLEHLGPAAVAPLVEADISRAVAIPDRNPTVVEQARRIAEMRPPAPRVTHGPGHYLYQSAHGLVAHKPEMRHYPTPALRTVYASAQQGIAELNATSTFILDPLYARYYDVMDHIASILKARGEKL